MIFLGIALIFLSQHSPHVSAERFVINDASLPDDPFLTVWNAPSENCQRKYGVFLDLAAFDIVANPGQQFIGEFMTIFYSLGKFPFFLHDGRAINGGLPQLGNLTAHLEKCKEDFKTYFPSKLFGGLAVIDLEVWLGLWEFNFDVRAIYKNKSRELVQKMHPTWNKSQVEAEAKLEFDTAARKYMEATILLARDMIPGGQWGYYHYPYCFNYKLGQSHCDLKIRERNDQISWLYKASPDFYPSSYLSTAIIDPPNYIYGQLEESFRIAYNDTKTRIPEVFLYSSYRYTDTKVFYSVADLINSIKQTADFGSSGLILWASSNDFATKDQCIALKSYLETTLGPFVKNITNYTRTCSKNVCSNHGRCQRKDLMALLNLSETIAKMTKHVGGSSTSNTLYFQSRDEYSMSKYLQGIQFEFQMLFEKTVQKMSSWTIESDEYRCRCYPGWGGDNCDKKI